MQWPDGRRVCRFHGRAWWDRCIGAKGFGARRGTARAQQPRVSEPAVGEMLDQYRITDLLAHGGMATIFKAFDTESGRTVVLKVPLLKFESDVVFFERFRREEQIGQTLDHEAIVKVYPAREKSRPYLAMELVEGQPLRALLDAGPLPKERALEIAGQLCEALGYLHEHGVVHRDLKPENVILTAGGGLKIIDFGLALSKAARRVTWTRLSATFGTPDYIAPEQLGGRRGDARTDIYAAGVMLFEMLTGQLPYQADHPQAMLIAKRTETPKLLSYFVPELDRTIETIVMRAIERAPRDRYASAAEMLADLRNPGGVGPREVATRRAQLPRRWVMPLVVGLILAGLLSLIWMSARKPLGPPATPSSVTR
jgi:serine/threonine-protein kinase